MLAASAVLGAACASDTRPPTSAFMAEAASAAAGLQRWYEGTTYRSAQWWQSASALETTIDYMQATGSRAYLGNLNRTYHAYHQGDRFLDNYYDDDGWWALAWIKAYDLTGDRCYLRQAQAIFEAMTDGWDSTCGGGIWWSTRRTYKNAIANGLFLTVAAELHNRTPGDSRYSAWALREWAWFSGSGMLTHAGLVIDGLDQCPGSAPTGPDPAGPGRGEFPSRPGAGMRYPDQHEYRFPPRCRAGLPGPRAGQPDAAQAVA